MRSVCTPVDVFGLQNDVAGIAAGFDHTCALTKSGRPMCWGHSPYGGVGDGTTATNPNSPQRVSGFTAYDVAKLALGESHTCALTVAGGVKCWGFNSQGELGNNSIAQSIVPVDVTGLTSGVASIGASKFHSCAVTTGGAVQCWGQNTSGSLGDGTQTERHVPTNVCWPDERLFDRVARVEPQLRAVDRWWDDVLGRQQRRRAGRRYVQPAAPSGERTADGELPFDFGRR